MVFGALTFQLMARQLAASANASEVADPWVKRMTSLPATVLAAILQEPLAWPNARVAHGDAVDVVARLKAESAVPLRSHGSLSMKRLCWPPVWSTAFR